MKYSQITTFPGTLEKLTPFSFLPILQQGKKKRKKKIILCHFYMSTAYHLQAWQSDGKQNQQEC